MRKSIKLLVLILLFSGSKIYAQNSDPVVQQIIKEASENSQLKKLAHELTDGIGPRLVGTPQMKQAHDWAIAKYESWGIPARNEKWGEWRGWERGITHIDMIHPRTESLEGMQLAWSPSSLAGGASGEVIILPQLGEG